MSEWLVTALCVAGVVAVVGGLAVCQSRAKENATAECADRGGVYHCTHSRGWSGKYYVSTEACDCYRSDRRVLLPGQKGEDVR